MYRGGAKPGHYVSEETKKKLSLIHKGKTNIGKRNSPDTEIKKGQRLSPDTEFKKGHGFHLGKSTPKPGLKKYYQNQRTMVDCTSCGETISLTQYRVKNHKHHFCSIKCRRLFYIGERNNKWKGGITPGYQVIRHSEESKEWKKKVLKRDGYTCTKCGIEKVRFHIHHIKPFSEYPELRFDVGNGATLCGYCHSEAHQFKFGLLHRLKKVIGK